MGPTLLFILAVAVGTQAGPIDTINRDANTCARTCTGTNKFSYEQDKTYEFEYKAKTTTSMVGASEGKADLEVTATAEIEVVSKCELVLRVQNANLFETDPTTGSSRPAEQSREFQRALETNPLRFSFQDGEIEELCPASGEQTWVLNIKRGILSMFQNTMDDFTRDQNVKESDVAGNCDAEYVAAENGWYSLSVKKTKNLLGCTDRHGYNSAIQGTPYRVPSQIQSLPIVKSTHECKQVISKEGHLTEASCNEAHVFRPFSRESSGAVTKSNQNLKFLRHRSGISTPPMVASRSKLMFEHAYDADKMARTKADLEGKLEEICQSTREDVRPETPKLFTDLIYLMRSMDADSLKTVYQKIKASQLCTDNNDRVRKFFLDAIPMVGTSASLRLLTELITSNDVTGIEADMWMTSLAFIQNPTKDMLKEVLPLLSETKGMLSVGTLVHSYCRIASCENDNDVRNIISDLESKIGFGCYVDDTNMKRIIIALRSIGNAGQASTVTSTISSCMARKENPTEVRLAAIDAFRRISCDADRSSILAIFNDKEEDSELRIGAYIALMECPTSSFLSRVKYTLEIEEANQVGSFIWTHLTNLMESSSRHKQTIRAILEDETLQREFDMDKRKFSRNYEGSFFLEKLNTGASLEGNLIWSSKSFIPRSAMANLTVDLFGHSINLFEIGGRIEGLEYFLEAYFGPNGYFSDEAAKEPEEQSVKGISTKKFKKIEKKFKSSMDEMKGSLYMRVFGNELRYNSFNGVNDLINGNNFNILDFLIKLSKDQDYTFTQNTMFLDSSMIIPTSTGFPLNLTVNGTATIDLKASGRMDLRKLGTSPRSVSINGMIKPSGSILISSMMSVDAFVTKSGMKMVSTLHSSTALQGHVELANGRIFSAQVDMPRDKMEILNFKTSFFTVHRDVEREQQMVTENRQTKRACTGDKLSKITGLEICGEAQFPNASLKTDAPYFPLTGPVSVALNLYKRDTHSGYKMESKLLNTKDEATVKFAFDTPGSSVDRAMGVDFSLKKGEKTVEMNMISPWKKATFTGKTQYDRNLKHLSGKLDVDGKTLYSIKSEIKRSRKGASYVYTPSLEIQIPKKKVISFGGSVSYQPKKLMDARLSLSGIAKKPIRSALTITNKKKLMGIKGSISFEKGKLHSFESRINIYETKKRIQYRPFLSIRSATKELAGIGGTIGYSAGKLFSVDLTVDKIFDKPVKVSANVRNAGNAKSIRYRTKVDIKSPILTTKLKSGFTVRGGKSVVLSTKMDYNIPKVIRDRISISAKINMAKTKTTTSLKGNTNLEFNKRPQYNVQIVGSMSHNKKHSEGNVEVTYGANKKDKSKRFVFSTAITPQLKWKSSNLIFDTLIQHPASDLDVHVNLAHRHNQKSLDSSILLERGKKKLVSSTLRLKNKSKSLTSLFGSLELSYPGRDLSVSNDLSENAKNDFTNEFSAELVSGQKSTIISNWRRPSPSEYEASSDIRIFNNRPMRVAGQVNIDPNNFRAQVEKDGQRYILTTSTSYKNFTSIVFNGELQYPSRRITAVIDAKNKYPVFSGRMDIKWNADIDESKRLQVDSKVMYEGTDSIDASLSVSYPTNTIAMNLKHASGKRYISHADITWGTSKTMTFDATFFSKGKGSNKQIKGTLKVSSPFRGFRSIAIDSTTLADQSKYTTNMNVNWKPMKKISGTVTINKPISWESIDASIVLKTPLKGYQRTSVAILHSLEKKLASRAKLNWNKNFLQIDVEGANKGSSRGTDVSGRVAVKSTISKLKTVILSFGHKSKGKKFENNVMLRHNKNKYSYDGEMTHALKGRKMQNIGRFTLTAPQTNYEASWTHKNTDANIESRLNAQWGQKRIQVNLNGAQDLNWPRGSMSTAFEIRSPFESLRHVGFTMKHLHREGLINTAIAVNKDENTLVSIENNYNRENNVAKSIHVLRAGDREVSLKSTTQYGSYPMTSKIDLQWSPQKKMELSGVYDKDTSGLMNGNLKFVSPFTEEKILTFDQNRDGEDVVSSASLQYRPEESFSIENRYQWADVKKIHITINTPYQELRRIQTEVELTGDLETFHSMGSIEVQPILRKVSLSSQWSSVGGLLGNARLETPFSQLPYIQLTLNSKMQGENRKSKVTVEYSPRQEISIETMGRLRPNDIESTIKIRTPFSKMPYTAAVLRHRGNLHNFQTHAEYECPVNGKYEADVNFRNQNNKEGSIVIKLPSRDDISALFTHSGDINNFQSHGEFGYEVGKKYEGDVKFEKSNKLEGSISVKSPLTNDMVATFKHVGGFDNFQSHGDLEFAPGKKMQADISFNSRRSVDGSMTLKIPGFDTINAAFNHRGKMSNFRSHAEITCTKGETYEADLVLNAVNNIITKVTINTPIRGYRKLKASLVHKGSLRSFTCRANLANGRRNIEGNVIFDLEPVVIAKASLETPFSGMRNLRAALSHDGSLKNFKTHVELSSGKQKEIVGDVQFAIKPSLKLIASLNTPFKAIETAAVTLTNEMTPISFNSHAEFSYLKHDPVVINAQYDSSSQIRAEVTVQTPFSGYEQLSGIVIHSGSIENFASSAEFANGQSKKISGDARFSMRGPVTGEITITTPFEGLKLNRIAFSHDGTRNNFISHGEVIYQGRKTESDITFSTLDSIEGSVILKSPHFDQLKGSFSSRGPISNLRSKANIIYGTESILDGVVSFANNPTTRGSISLQAIYIPRTQMTFSHEGPKSNFHTQAEVVVGRRRMELDAAFNAVNDISGNIIFKSPFTGDVQAAVSHTGRRSGFRSHLEGAIDGQKIESDVTFSTRSGISASVTLKTPFSQYREIEASYTHTGKLQNFKCNAEYIHNSQKTEFESSFSSVDQITGRAVLKTPTYSDIIVQFNHGGTMQDFTSHGEISYSGAKQMIGDLTMRTRPSINYAVAFRTPFHGIESVEAIVKHEGSLRNFRSEAEYTRNSEKSSLNVNFDSSDDVVAKVVLSLPETNDIVLGLTHSGALNDFHSHAEMFYSGAKQYEYDAAFNAVALKSIDGNLVVKTPVIGWENLAIVLNHKCNDQRMATIYSMEGFTEPKIELTVDLEKGLKKEFTLTLTSPFSRDVRIVSAHEGSLPNIKSSLDIFYDTREKFHGELDLTSGRKTSGSLLVRVVGQNVNALFNHEGNFQNLKNHAEISYNDQKIESDILLKNIRETTASVTFRSPIRYLENIGATVSHASNTRRTNSHAELSYNGNNIVGDFSLRNGKKTVASIQLQTPFRNFENNQGSLAYEKTQKGQNLHTEFMVNGKKYESDALLNTEGPLETSFAVKTPFSGYENTKVALNHQMENGQLQTHAEFVYGNSKRIETDINLRNNPSLEGSFTLRTPFSGYEEITTSFRHHSSDSSVESHAEISCNAQKKIEADISLRTRGQIQGSVSLKTPLSGLEESSIAIRRDGQKYQLEISYNQGKRIEMEVYIRHDQPSEGHVILKTPFAGFEQTRASFRHQISSNNMVSHAELIHGEKKIEGDLALSMSPIKVTLSMKTPFSGFESATFAMQHDQTSDMFKTHSELIYGQEKIEGDIEMTKAPLTGTFTLKTPFDGFRETVLAFHHDQTPSSLSSHAELIYAQQKIEGDLALSTSPIQATLSMKTPFSGFESATFALQHEQTSDMFKTHSELIYRQEKVETDIEFTRTPLTGTVTLKTPFDGFRETVLAFHHDQTPNSLSSHAELIYGQQKKLEGDISFENNRQMEGRLTVKTPFSGFEESSASFQHLRSSSNLKSHAEVIYGQQQKVETDVSVNYQDHLEGRFALKTPIEGYRAISASLRHKPLPGNVVSHAEISCENQMSTFDLEVENRIDTFGITASVKTPWYDNIGLLLSRNGPLDNLIVKGETTLGSEKPVELLIKNVKIGSKIESSLLFKNPYMEDMSASFDHNGGWNRFRSTADASLGSQNRLRSETTFRRRTGFMSLGSTIESVLDGSSRTGNFKVKHDGDINNFKSSMSASYEGQKIDMKANFKNAAVMEGSFTLKTPIDGISNIGASFQHSGGFNQFSTTGNFQYAPGKQLEGKVEYFKLGWGRLSSSVELKTPFNNYRLTKLTYKHRGDGDSIQCNGDLLYGSGQQLIGSLTASKTPLSIAVAARTPFTGYEDISASAKYEEQSNKYSTEANIVYSTGKKIEVKSVLDMQANPMAVTGKLTTPFVGLESTEIILTKSGSYNNFRTTGEFQSSYVSPFKAEADFRYDDLSEMEGTITFNSQIDNLENLKFNVRNTKTGDEYHSHVESSWSTSDVVVADALFSLSERWNGKYVSYGLSSSTPFDFLRNVNVKGNMEYTDKYSESISIEYNGESILDMDAEYSNDDKHIATVNIREPRPMKLNANGVYTDSQKGGDLTVNWNTRESDSNIKLEGMLNGNNDYYTNKRDFMLKGSKSGKSLAINGVLEKSTYRMLSSVDLTINENKRYGYEVESTSSSRDEQEGYNLKLCFPSRTIALTSSYGPNSAEGAILWDADRDQSKKVGLKANLIPQRDSVKAEVSFSMPSIGKDVQVDSEMTLNNGQIIFDGKTEFRYSDDTRKTLVLHSKLQDTSAGYSKNYSLVFGISHPYTSVDIQMKSHVGHSDEKYTAGMDVLYLTAQRQQKNFALMGEIDNFRNEMNVQIISPAKSLRLQGNVKTQAPYQVSVSNLYDSRPISAQATLNPERRSMDLSINYDLANPRKVFHMSAKYVNDSAIVAEIYREENSERTTDSLLAVRLNTSRILHTRLHWRPTVLQELKEYGLDKIQTYGTRLDSAVSEAGEALSQELNYKYNVIRQAVSEDFQPYANFVTERMTDIGAEIEAARHELNRMYQTNEYYTQDIYVYYDRALRDIQTKYNTKMEQVRQWSESIKTAASSWTYFPLKDQYDHYLLLLREILQEGEQTTSVLYRQLLETVESQLIELSKSMEEAYSAYQAKLNDSLSVVSGHPHVQYVQDKYTQYLNKLRSFKIPQQAQDLAQQYSSAIYNARETINTGLSTVMNRKDIKYVKSVANEAYYQGAAAYKYWEVEENVKAVLQQIYEYIREEIEEEIISLKDSLINLKKSGITVYDPEHGEIQSDIYLPISLTSLDTVPKINVVKYVNKVKSYIPDSSSWRSPMEYIPEEIMPPFKGVAKVVGDHVTTFDGQEFDISGRCSYILARDYINGNFTIMLDYLSRQKRKLVVYTPTQNIQVSPTGKVKVDGRLAKLPYESSEVKVKQEGDFVFVSSQSGFSIVVDTPRDSFYIKVNGWYFGKTGGLLGTLNNERYDDMMMSNKKVTNDVNAFADSWEVDNNC